MERVENVPGRQMPLGSNPIFVDIPADTYRYICTPWMDSTCAYNGHQHDAAVCINEYGVAMTMSVTAFSNKRVFEADPLVPSGVNEGTINDLVVCQSKTAEEAVRLLLGYIDTYGSAEVNIALIADQKEVWYVEMYSGHQYAAVKLPSDAVSVFGNEFSLEYLSTYEKSIVSDGLESIPKESGFAVYGDDGELNLLDTYSGAETLTDYSHLRTWFGHKLLAGGYDTYDPAGRYPLCFQATDKVSLQDVLNLMRNRYEGTEYSPDEQGRIDVRVIGTDTALSVHAVQVLPELPANMSCVLWECFGPDVCGTFVPVSNLCDSVSVSFGKNQPGEDAGVFDTEGYPWFTFKELTTLGLADFSVYGKPVQDYWKRAETGTVSGMRQVLEKASGMDTVDAENYVTAYCNAVQEKAFADAKEILNDMKWYMNKNSNTLKKGRDPETHRILDENVVPDPLEIRCDSSGYAVVPEPVLAKATVDSINEFGDAILSVSTEEFEKIGFRLGDSLCIRLKDRVLEDIPYYGGYFGSHGTTLVVNNGSVPNVVLSTMCVGFSKLTGGRVGDTVTITLGEKDGFAENLKVFGLSYSDRIEDYPDRDAFINARCSGIGDIPDGRLYRSASPADDSRGRAAYASEYGKEHGVQTVLNLAQEESTLQEMRDTLPEWTREMLDRGNIIGHKYSADYQSDEFKKQLGKDLAELAARKGPYLIHCLEGKDRTGFVLIVIEALCGANYLDMADDYLETYANYYGFTAEDSQLATLYKEMFVPMMQYLTGETSEIRIIFSDLQQKAVSYLLDCGMTEEQIRDLYTAMTE